MGGTRIGVIGSGYWGPNIIRNFAEIPDCELVAIADLDEAKLATMRERHRQVALTTTDYRALFEADLDAVAICTPPQTHHKIARDCLDHGLHTLIEKPIATSSADTRDLIETAAANDVRLMVGHTFEYNPAVRELKMMVASGSLGDVRYIDMVRVGLGLYNPQLNVIWDLAPHDISILIYLLGAVPETVSAEAVSCVSGVVEDVAYLTFGFASGVTAHARVSWLDPSKTRRTTVVGSEKMVIYDDVEPNEKLRVFDKGVEAVQGGDSFGEFQFSYRYGDIVSPFIEFKEPLRVQCQHFVECVETGIRPLTDGESGLRVIELIEALQESLRRNGDRVRVGAAPASDLSAEAVR